MRPKMVLKEIADKELQKAVVFSIYRASEPLLNNEAFGKRSEALLTIMKYVEGMIGWRIH